MPYPVSDHYDGELFFNPEPTTRKPPDGSRQRGIAAIILSRLLRRKHSGYAVWPKHLPNPAFAPPAGMVEAGSLALTFIGHSTFLLRLPGLTVLTDPVFSRRCSPVSFAGPARVRDPGVALDDLPKVDLILLSHNHYDHCDIASLRRLRQRFPDIKIVTALGNRDFLARKGLAAVELDWWQNHQFGDALVTAVPARHFAARTLKDRNQALWVGFVLAYRGQSIYFAGDTGYTKFFKEIATRLGAPDLALLPIGAYEPRWFMGPVHMNPADAVAAFGDLGCTQAVGMHFGTFQLTAEDIDAPERDLATAGAASGIAEAAFTTLGFGETRVF